MGCCDPLRRLLLIGGAGLALPLTAAEPVVPLAPLEVVGIAPLPGLGTPLEQIPANVQSFGARELGRQRTGGVAEFLDWNANSVSTNSPSGNAFQPDVSFRGFTASSLLGTPQGLSVFQDGVRINEAFADVVNWDLLPKSAVASMQLLPGSNPIFGLNTLGGALTINMKDGFAHSGAGVAASAGSFGRTELEADGGVNNGTLAAFAVFEAIDEDGWRDHSRTRIRRLYARADARDDRNDASIAATVADNSLAGTQSLPVSMLGSPRQAYTWPDTTENRLAFFNVNARHAFDERSIVAANAYYRDVRTNGTNSNVNGDYAPPDNPFEAFNVLSVADTRSWGFSLQATFERAWGATVHQLVAGAALDIGTTDFTQSAQPAMFTADRQAVGVGEYVPATAVTASSHYAGLYAADTIALSKQWTIAVSGRYNTARLSTQDQTGGAPAINGTNTYRRFNPAAGITWIASDAFNAFAGASQGMRVPTPVELTCADPSAPCTLPNIFVADPPLQPVRATTYEAGARGRLGSGGFYRAALFRTNLNDDIQFISAGSGAVNAGYFQNVGRTRRQGLEVTAGAALAAWRITGHYSLLDATYRTSFVQRSPNNSTANAAGDIVVAAGDRLPGLPRNVLRVRADWTEGPYALGVSMLAASSQYARGNENNADPNGRIGGYAVVALDASWQIAPEWQLFARVDNLFDTAYRNFGILGANYFRGPGNTFDASLAASEAFQSPAPPFGIWVGIAWRLDRGRDKR